MAPASDMAGRILALFSERGFAPVAPPILQPADVFIEKSGEDIRARTFLFSDPDGVQELCLRPDLTVPTCRWHLSHADDPTREAKYCYAGPVFRYDGPGDPLHPQEYEQAGLEWFGAPDAEAADAEVLALAVAAVRSAGLEALSITIGDVGLIRALLADIDMPARWRARLLRRFRNPDAFHATLRGLAGRHERARTSISPFIDELAQEPTMERALALTEAELDRRKLELIGGRTLEDIATRLLEKAENRATEPLPADAVALLEDFLRIAGTPQAAIDKLNALAGRAGARTQAAAQRFAARMERIAALLPEAAIRFDAAFGRTFDYYTGFVFQLEATAGGGRMPVAGGGRYDDMLESLGGPAVPALGMALSMPRLQAAITMHTGGAAA